MCIKVVTAVVVLGWVGTGHTASILRQSRILLRRFPDTTAAKLLGTRYAPVLVEPFIFFCVRVHWYCFHPMLRHVSSRCTNDTTVVPSHCPLGLVLLRIYLVYHYIVNVFYILHVLVPDKHVTPVAYE